MKKELLINSDLQLLTTTQMNEIWGGDNEFQGDLGEIELPKLPNLPASTPPAFVPEYNNQ